MAKQRRIAEQYARASRFHQTGRLKEAEALYQEICKAEPNHAESWHRLGVLLHQSGRKDSVDCFRRAIELRPDIADLRNDFGVVLAAYGQLEEAIVHFAHAVVVAPNHSGARTNLGHGYRQRGRLDEALAQYAMAVSIAPTDALLQVHLGSVFSLQGNTDAAYACYNKALAIDPNCVMAYYHLALACKSQGLLEEAVSYNRKAIERAPKFAEAHNNLGMVLRELGRLDEARLHYETALALSPHFIEARMNLAHLLGERGQPDAAITHYEKIIIQRPNFVPAHYELGVAYRRQGAFAEARSAFERVLAIDPHHAEARLALTMTHLPVLYQNKAEIDACREAYAASLTDFTKAVERFGSDARFEDAIGSYQPFYLAYQGMNDRDLQTSYGNAICKVTKGLPEVRLASPPAAGELLRVGFVSGFFYHHSNWKIPIKGWLAQLDRNRFRVFGYSTGLRKDEETAKAAALCERFVEAPLSIGEWYERIAADAPHVLIYPELGMDKTCAQLAAQRLAPVQCVSWGHPTTSGFPTIDYFLSSALMEPEDADAHYTEKLVRLPNLSVYCDRPKNVSSTNCTRAEFGLRDDAIVYWSGQSPSKYLPQYDDVFPRIAREAGNCQFVFVAFSGAQRVTKDFEARLYRAFEVFGLKASDYCVILPRLTPDRFNAGLSLCDIFLDSIGWSGCNSTLESLGHAKPIVTMKTNLMRGRHTAAILEMMGIDEGIADTIEGFIEIATRLAADGVLRAEMHAKIVSRRDRIYHDTDCVSALEDFLIKAASSDGLSP